MQLMESRLYDAITQILGAEVIELLGDDSVIEILRNPNGALCVERLGRDVEESNLILSDRNTEALIRLLASHANEVCNEKSPSLAMKLPYWQARFQGLLPPVVDAPSFSIRKHAKHMFSLADYVANGSLTALQREALLEAVWARLNIVISGGTGSGKTTFANAILAEMINTGDRIITVEDTSELRLPSKKGMQIFTKSTIGYGSQQALKDILRLRPDRIVLGELRDGACLDLIKSWNTGHAGGLTTVHANSCELALRRIESLIAEISVNVPHELIAQTVNVVIQIQREGSRRVVKDMKKITNVNNGKYHLEDFGGNYAAYKTDHRAERDGDMVYLS
jgi:type IV secretion system protein VirB11